MNKYGILHSKFWGGIELHTTLASRSLDRGLVKEFLWLKKEQKDKMEILLKDVRALRSTQAENDKKEILLNDEISFGGIQVDDDGISLEDIKVDDDDNEGWADDDVKQNNNKIYDRPDYVVKEVAIDPAIEEESSKKRMLELEEFRKKEMIKDEEKKSIFPGSHLRKGVIKSDRLDKYVNNSFPAVYLVMFRRLNDNSNTLVYNYVYYPFVFTDYILAYFISKGDVKQGLTIGEWGDYLTVIDNRLGYTWQIEELKDNYIESNEYFEGIDNYTGNIHDYLILLDIIKQLNLICDIETMSSLVDWGFKHCFYEFFNTFEDIFLHYNNKGDLPPVNPTYYGNDILKTFVVKDCLFVVEDLDSLIKNLNIKNKKLVLCISSYNKEKKTWKKIKLLQYTF